MEHFYNAIFYRDGTIEVVETNHLISEITKFNEVFAEKLEGAFKVIVNGGTYTYPYTVIDGKARL